MLLKMLLFGLVWRGR